MHASPELPQGPAPNLALPTRSNHRSRASPVENSLEELHKAGTVPLTPVWSTHHSKTEALSASRTARASYGESASLTLRRSLRRFKDRFGIVTTTSPQRLFNSSFQVPLEDADFPDRLHPVHHLRKRCHPLQDAKVGLLLLRTPNGTARREDKQYKK